MREKPSPNRNPARKYFRYLFLWIAFIGPAGRGYAQACAQVSVLPTFCITTEAAVTSKDIYVGGSLKIIASPGTTGLYDGGIRIRGRGNSTWDMSKKPYRINLNTASSLLGMPAIAKNWVLLANYADKTLIRNAVAFEISKFLGLPYTPPYRFVDVVLNGDNLGSYLLTDHIEVRENRVDIEEEEEESVPGAYLMELDGFAASEDFYITTSQNLLASFKFPDNMTEAHATYIKNHVNTFEARLFSDTPSDGPGGYLEYADLASLVNWYLACELTGNPDSFWSVYLHKRRSDNHFFLGPLWDFDIAFDNDDRISSSRYRLMADVAHNFRERKWIIRLRKDDVFMRAVKKRWNEVMDDGFKAFILGKVPELSGLLVSSGSMAENFARWPVLNVKVYREVFPSGSYTQHVDFLYDYLSQRIDWLDREINGVPSGYFYKFGNSIGNKALSVEYSGERPGAVQKAYMDGPSFNWQIIPLPNGFYQLKNVAADMLLTGNSTPGGPLFLSQANAEDPLQQWRITQVAAARYAIVGRQSVFGAQSRENMTSEGNPIDQVPFNTYTNSEVRYWLADPSVGRWTITPVSEALPIRILPLTARYAEGAVHLYWTVTEQFNGSHFEVERLDREGKGQYLAHLGLAGQGEYTWTDDNPFAGINYYRLRLVDLDGSVAYSNMVSVKYERETFFVKVYPNPSFQASYAEINVNKEGEVNLEIYNSIGQCVSRSQETVGKGVNRLLLRTEGLPAGLYLVKIHHRGIAVVARFVKGNY